MAGTRRAARLTRRRLLASAGSSAAITLLGGIARPYLSRASDRPLITHGIQSGDVSVDSGVVWARTDRPARMLVEVSTSDSFVDIRDAVAVDALPESDFTAKVLLEDLPPARIFSIASASRIFPRRRSRASRRSAISAPRQSIGARCLVRVVGRHRRAGLGHRRSARRHAHLRDHAEQSSGLLHPLRRHHLRRLPDPVGADAAQWRDLAQHRHRGEIRSGAKRSPTIAATTNIICSMQICAPSTPRSRLSRNGTTTKSPTTGVRAEIRADYANTKALLLAARGRRAFREYMPVRADPRRNRPHLSQGCLRSAARYFPAGYAELSRPERRGAIARRAGQSHSWTRRNSNGSSGN